MHRRHVYKAVIAAAGTGSRLVPITYAIPKEMLPIGRKPVLHHIVDELRGAGIREALFIVSPNKMGIIEKYFRRDNKWGLKFDFLTQREPLGSGQAVLCAQSWVGKEPFVVAWGDTLVWDTPESDPPLKRMIQYAGGEITQALVLTQRVSKVNKSVFRHAVVPVVKPRGSKFWSIKRIITADSRACRSGVCAGIAGRWILPPVIFDYLQRLPTDKEMYLVDAVSNFLLVNGTLTAMVLGKCEYWHDIGTWDTYFQALSLGIDKERTGSVSNLR